MFVLGKLCMLIKNISLACENCKEKKVSKIIIDMSFGLLKLEHSFYCKYVCEA